MRLVLLSALAIASVATGVSATPSARKEIAAGERIVRRDCSGCHSVGLTGKSPMSAAPPFRDLHRRYDVEQLAESLAEGIAVGHPAMPVRAYDPPEIQAVIRYMKSLSGSPKAH